LQQRAPEESKGSMVATSNFLNVTGGLVAVVVFYFVTFGLQAIFGLALTSKDADQSEGALRAYITQLEVAGRIPSMLFISASLITAVVLVLLCWQRPDFLLRAFSWFRIPARRRLRAVNADFVPGTGPLIVATNCERLDQWMHVIAVLDRFTRFVPHEVAAKDDPFLAKVARRLRVSLGLAAADRTAHELILARAEVTLLVGDLVALPLASGRGAEEGAALFGKLQEVAPADILPVYCGEHPNLPPASKASDGRTSVVVGEPLPAESSVEDVQTALARLGR
jgi:hypothetical protein